MIMDIFTFLSNSLYGFPLLALFASLIWGVLSIILSPCHLSSIPLIVGFMSKEKKMTFRKSFIISFIFSFGIMISILLIGVLTASFGRMLGDIGLWGNIFISIIFIIIGLNLIGIIKFTFFKGINLYKYNLKGYFAPLLIGLLFGIAVGPCTFAYMAPILGFVFSISSNNLAYSILLLIAYAIGHCSVIIIAGVTFEVVEKVLHLQKKTKPLYFIKIISGLLVLFAGVYLGFNVLKSII